MATDRWGERRSQEERNAAAVPERIPPEDFYPTVVDALSDVRELIRPMGQGFVAHLESLVAAVESGTFSRYQFDMKQEGPVPVNLHIDLQGKGSGPSMHAWAEGDINGEKVRAGGLLIKTPATGIFWRSPGKDEEPIAKEGANCTDPGQIVGYIQQGKLPRRPFPIPNAAKLFPNGFEIVAFEAADGQRVTKAAKEHTILLRVRKL